MTHASATDGDRASFSWRHVAIVIDGALSDSEHLGVQVILQLVDGGPYAVGRVVRTDVDRARRHAKDAGSARARSLAVQAHFQSGAEAQIVQTMIIGLGSV